MGRPKGRRNEDYGASRDDLLQRVEAELLAPRGARLSFRALARAADVTPPTLRHYFGTHDGLILAVLERLRASWSAELRALARCEGPPEESLAEVIAVLCRAWGERLGAAHELGLRLGPQLSPRFLDFTSGNVVDRLVYGAVADFLNMSLPGWQNPYSFNVADVAIFLGAVGLVLFTGKDHRANDG